MVLFCRTPSLWPLKTVNVGILIRESGWTLLIGKRWGTKASTDRSLSDFEPTNIVRCMSSCVFYILHMSGTSDVLVETLGAAVITRDWRCTACWLLVFSSASRTWIPGYRFSYKADDGARRKRSRRGCWICQTPRLRNFYLNKVFCQLAYDRRSLWLPPSSILSRTCW